MAARLQQPHVYSVVYSFVFTSVHITQPMLCQREILLFFFKYWVPNLIYSSLLFGGPHIGHESVMC